MKPMNNDNNPNWLDFKMEIPSSSSSTASVIPSSLNFHSSYGINYCNSIMPLKSDGSLCLMEALTRSQSQVAASSTPKLEDFFAGSMETNHYELSNHRSEAIYYPFYNNNVSNCNLQLPLTISRNNYEANQLICNNQVDLQSLSLSMSPGSQQISKTVNDSCVVMETKKRGSDKLDNNKQIVHRKSIDTFGQRTSQFRGVTRHRWTGRYEAHLWDNSCKKEGQSRKGRQVYLGGYDMEEKAARAYDLAAIKYWGPSTHINFPVENYRKEVEEMKNMSRQEFVAHLRRKSSGFSRGASIYRGVTRHHQHGRWQARIGRVAGNKDLYLGTFSTQEEAAEAYDVAAIKFRGVNAVTNFDITRYDVERIMASNTLLAGEVARRNKDLGPTNEANASTNNAITEPISTGYTNNQSEANWKMALYQSPQCHQPGQKVANMNEFDKSMGIDLEESAKMGSHHLSNASSLVTSLSSSREGSPDRTSVPMMFAMPTSKLFDNSKNVDVSSSWFSTPELGLASPLALPQMPVFAAWTDS